MSKNTSLATSNNAKGMSLEGATKLCKEVHEGLAIISKGYISVMPQLNKLYDCKGFKALGYNNFDDFCKMEFGMSHGTTVGIRKVWGMIGSVTANNEYIIPEKYKDWGYTQLLMIAQDKAKFEEVGIKPFEVFTPDMTIKEMANTLKAKLEEKAQDQDNNAIDTSASEDTSASDDNFDVFTSLLSDATTVRSLFEGTKNAKVIANLDSLEAIIKDLKKAYEKLGK